MKYARTLAGTALLGGVALLSGCVVTPLGPYPGGYYAQPAPGYAEPALVVAPPPVSFGFYGGYYRPHYGYRDGHRGGYGGRYR
jgi:hypothetical protein